MNDWKWWMKVFYKLKFYLFYFQSQNYEITVNISVIIGLSLYEFFKHVIFRSDLCHNCDFLNWTMHENVNTPTGRRRYYRSTERHSLTRRRSCRQHGEEPTWETNRVRLKDEGQQQKRSRNVKFLTKFKWRRGSGGSDVWRVEEWCSALPEGDVKHRQTVGCSWTTPVCFYLFIFSWSPPVNRSQQVTTRYR